MKLWSMRGYALAMLGVLPLLAACGSSGETSSAGRFTTGTGGHGHSTGAGGTDGNSGFGGSFTHGGLESITVEPPQALIDVQSGGTATQQFHAIGHYKDQTTEVLTSVSWSANGLAIGTVDATGTFTANGSLGGSVKITAGYGTQSATGNLDVRLHVQQNPDNVDPATQSALQQASAQDAQIAWAYPYDGTVFPRGIGGPPLMWMGGPPTDTFRIHAVSATYELEVFKTGVGMRYDFDPATWEQLATSSSGAVELQVSRLDGGSAKLVVDHHYTIAPASMRGTIYYWAINTGRVMRIKPGASAPENFLDSNLTCPSCHTASANGSRLILNEGSWPSETSVSYDLGSGASNFTGLPSGATGASRWALAAVSPDGKVVIENFAPLRGNIGQVPGAFDALTGAQLPNTGLETRPLFMPVFSPDNQLLAYVDPQSRDLRAFDWDGAARKATNDRPLVTTGSDPSAAVIGFPTSSPDHKWIVYQRSDALGSLGNAADLYIASVDQPGMEAPLANLNGTNYPFAAGARDLRINYEPTFAPVAAGGYFWVVFHSRRTFGNALTGPAYQGEGVGTKQLWVAAIDQNPVPGQDPSHPAFHLPGQDLDTLNMRGYWALDPCKADGQACESGTECCGGYCDTSSDAGAAVCKSTSTGCANSGDHCATAADCCDVTEVCINDVCSESPPH